MSSFWVKEQLLGKWAIIEYHTRAIMARRLYILNLLLEDQKQFFRVFFVKLCMVSIQELFTMHSTHTRIR